MKSFNCYYFVLTKKEHSPSNLQLFNDTGVLLRVLIVVDAHQQQVVSVLSHLRRIILPFNLGDGGISGLVLLQFHY